MDILDDASSAMAIVGKRFETGRILYPRSHDGRRNPERHIGDCQTAP